MNINELRSRLDTLKKIEEEVIFRVAAVSGAKENIMLFPEKFRDEAESIFNTILSDTNKHTKMIEEMLIYLS